MEIDHLKKFKGFTDADEIKLTDFKKDFEIQCVTTQSIEGLENGETNAIFLTFNQ